MHYNNPAARQVLVLDRNEHCLPVEIEPMRLNRLVAELKDAKVPAPAGDAEVTGIALDSRNVQPGNLFVAIHGAQVDGHRFIGDAVELGASAVVGERSLPDLRDLMPEVDLSAVPGPLKARWVDPRDGTLSDAKTVTGGGVREFTAPGAGDWALWLAKE